MKTAGIALAGVFVLWVLLAVLWASTIGAELGVAQEVLPLDSPVVIACAQAGVLAEASQVGMLKCRLVGISYQPDVAPNQQIVTVRVKISGQGWFQVKVYLMRAVWTPVNQTVTPEVSG